VVFLCLGMTLYQFAKKSLLSNVFRIVSRIDSCDVECEIFFREGVKCQLSAAQSIIESSVTLRFCLFGEISVAVEIDMVLLKQDGEDWAQNRNEHTLNEYRVEVFCTRIFC